MPLHCVTGGSTRKDGVSKYRLAVELVLGEAMGVDTDGGVRPAAGSGGQIAHCCKCGVEATAGQHINRKIVTTIINNNDTSKPQVAHRTARTTWQVVGRLWVRQTL